MNLPSPIEDINTLYDHEGNYIRINKPEKEVLKQLYESYKSSNKNNWPFIFKKQEIHLKQEGQKIFEELIDYEYQILEKKDTNRNYNIENAPDNSNILSEFEEENIIHTRKSQATFYQIFKVKNKVNLRLVSFETDENSEEKMEEEDKFPYKLECGTIVFPLNAYKKRESKITITTVPVFQLTQIKKFNLNEFHHNTYSTHQTLKDQN